MMLNMLNGQTSLPHVKLLFHMVTWSSDRCDRQKSGSHLRITLQLSRSMGKATGSLSLASNRSMSIYDPSTPGDTTGDPTASHCSANLGEALGLPKPSTDYISTLYFYMLAASICQFAS